MHQLGEAVTVEWKAFLLRPFPEARSVQEFRAYTRSWLRPAALEPDAGLRPWAGDASPPTHSVPAQVAAKVAETFGAPAFRSYHWALMRAYFTEHRTISDRTVLVELAEQVGLPGDGFDRRLTERWDDLVQVVSTEHNQAVDSGITGVPAVVVDGRYLISGAVDVDHYRQAVSQVQQERAAR